MNNKKKAVVLLAGHLRTFDTPIMRKNWSKFFAEADFTVYGCFWDNRGKSNWSTINGITPEMNSSEIVSLDRVREIFSTNNIQFRNQEEFVSTLPSEYIPIRQSRFFGALICQSYIRNEVCRMMEDHLDPNGIGDVAYTITRPDFIWFRKPPQSVFVPSEKLCHPDSPQEHYPKRVYDTILSANRETILKIGKMYSDKRGLLEAIASNHNNTLEPTDMCRVYYNYAINKGIPLTNWDCLYGDVFRQDSDVQYYENRYTYQNKLWCLT